MQPSSQVFLALLIFRGKSSTWAHVTVRHPSPFRVLKYSRLAPGMLRRQENAKSTDGRER